MSPARRRRDHVAAIHAAQAAGRGIPKAKHPKGKGVAPAELTLAAKVAQRAAARTAVESAPPAAANDNDPAERREPSAEARIRLALAEDKRRLKTVQSMEQRAVMKREMMPAYLPWVAGVISAAETRRLTDPEFNAPQDDVVLTYMIWKLDTGDLVEAAGLLLFALEHGWAMPGNFKRNLPTFVAEQAAEQALKAIEAGAEDPLLLVALITIEDAVRELDMPDEVRAQLHKALGREYARRADAPAGEGEPVMAGQKRARLEAALEHLRRAYALDAQCGVKGEVGRLEKAVAKEEPASTSPASETPPAINPNSQEPPPSGA